MAEATRNAKGDCSWGLPRSGRLLSGAPFGDSFVDQFLYPRDGRGGEGVGSEADELELGGDRAEWDQAFEAMARDGITALLVSRTPFLCEQSLSRGPCGQAPAADDVSSKGVCRGRGSDGLGANIDDVSRHAAIYADKILKGANPAELPLRGRLDLEDTIKRLKAYEAAGADALMAPGLPDLEAVRAVCSAVGKPFNFMVGIKGKSFTVAALAAAGVKRISLATSLYRAAMTGLLSAAKEVREHGTFGYIDTSLATPDMNAFLRE